MNEEEIINRTNQLFKDNKECFETIGEHLYLDDNRQNLIQGLLNLYNKEKLNSFNLSEQLDKEKEKNEKLIQEIKDILNKDRDCLTYGYRSAYVELIDELYNLVEDNND